MRRIIDLLFPMCPNGGHRQKGRLVTNVYGNQYCHHRDCMKANFREVQQKQQEEDKRKWDREMKKIAAEVVEIMERDGTIDRVVNKSN